MSYVTHISNNNIEDIYARDKINSLVDKVRKLSFAVEALCEVIRGLSNANAIKINFFKRVYNRDNITGGTAEGYLGDIYEDAIENLTHGLPTTIDVDQKSNIF